MNQRIEANSIWKRKTDGKLFIVSGVGSTGAGHYVTVENYNNETDTKYSPITDGQIPKDQFLRDHEIT